MPHNDSTGSTSAFFYVKALNAQSALISSTTQSTSTTTGALIIPNGGVGIGGNLNIGGTLTVGGTTLPFTVNSGFKNLLINGNFTIAQRGTSFSFGASVPNLDRWIYASSGGSGGTAIAGSISQQNFTLGQTAVPGEPANFIRLTNTNTGTTLGANSFHIIQQRINDVRTFAGQTCTVSFYAQSSISGKKIAISLYQNFGSGGSSLVSINGISFSLTSTFTKYTATFAIPSISGKTIGSGSYIYLQIWLQGDSAYDANTGTSGGLPWSNTGTIDISNVQLELGSQATGFEYRNNQQELDMCQFYYQMISVSIRVYSPVAGIVADSMFSFRNMRITPTATLYLAGSKSNISGTPAVYILSPNSGRFEINASAASTDTFDIGESYSLSAEL